MGLFGTKDNSCGQEDSAFFQRNHSKAYNKGVKDASKHKAKNPWYKNPYKPGSCNFYAWNHGWMDS